MLHMHNWCGRTSLIRKIRLLISSVGSSKRPCLFTSWVSLANSPDVRCMPNVTSETNIHQRRIAHSLCVYYDEPFAISDDVSWKAVFTSVLVTLLDCCHKISKCSRLLITCFYQGARSHRYFVISVYWPEHLLGLQKPYWRKKWPEVALQYDPSLVLPISYFSVDSMLVP